MIMNYLKVVYSFTLVGEDGKTKKGVESIVCCHAQTFAAAENTFLETNARETAVLKSISVANYAEIIGLHEGEYVNEYFFEAKVKTVLVTEEGKAVNKTLIFLINAFNISEAKDILNVWFSESDFSENYKLLGIKETNVISVL
jgi:hypothetical protein